MKQTLRSPPGDAQSVAEFHNTVILFNVLFPRCFSTLLFQTPALSIKASSNYPSYLIPTIAKMAEETAPDQAVPPVLMPDHLPTGHDGNPSHSRKSTLEVSMYDINVTGTTTPSSIGGQHKSARHIVELDEYFVSDIKCTLSFRNGG